MLTSLFYITGEFTWFIQNLGGGGVGGNQGLFKD